MKQLIRINFDIEKDPEDGEFGYYVKKGEIGEICSLLNKDEKIDSEKVYLLKFSKKDGIVRNFGTLINEPFYTKI